MKIILNFKRKKTRPSYEPDELPGCSTPRLFMLLFLRWFAFFFVCIVLLFIFMFMYLCCDGLAVTFSPTT